MKSINIKTLTAVITPIILMLAILLPIYSFAASLVPCNGTTVPCTFDKVIELIKNVVNFLLFAFAVPLAAISFAIAGVMILTAGGNTGQVEKAKEIFWNVLIGLIVALSAWLIVSAITGALQSSEVPSLLQ